MRTSIAAALAGSLVVWSCMGQEPLSVGRSHVTLQTLIHVQYASSGSPLRELLQIGLFNRVPLGIVIGTGGRICRGNLGLSVGDITVAALLDKMNNTVPGYHAGLSDGVIDVTETKLSPGATELLGTVLPEYKSGRGTYKLVAFWLWTYVRAAIAPNEGTAYVGEDSTDAEVLAPFELRQATVKQALNEIVSRGHGATWVFHDPEIPRITNETQMPFRIYGYTGDQEALFTDIACSR